MPDAGLVGPWGDGGRCAVSLSYDGGLPGHVEHVLPLLRRLGFWGTFYLTPERLLERPSELAAAVREGHEVGSHSLLGAALEDGSLPNWTLEMVHGDLEMTQRLLDELLPAGEHLSFAYPGPSPFCAEGSYDPIVRKTFTTARSAVEGINSPVAFDPYCLRQVGTVDRSFEDLRGSVEEAAAQGGWAVFAFEGIGVGDAACDQAVHDGLCAWLREQSNQIWVAPVSAVAAHLLAEPAAR